jgi:endonuclease III
MPKRFSAAEAQEFFARLKKLDPAPKTELNYVNPYTLLVAVALSAQATDKGVNKATAPLFKTVTTPQAMVALGEAGLTEAIKTIGLYRGKARNVIALSKILLDQHGGQVPQNREALEALPGVGRKTANVVLNVAFGEPTIAVDTAGKDRARSFQEPCASLADPARALHLHRPQAAMPDLRGARPVPLQGQNERAADRKTQARYETFGGETRSALRQASSAADRAPLGRVSTWRTASGAP